MATPDPAGHSFGGTRAGSTAPAADPWAAQFPALTALPRGGAAARRLRICIATEDIAGPARGGGIGTTYTALAELLAGLPVDVTILYLRGHDIENGDVERWIAHYAAKGLRFVPVPDYARAAGLREAAERWLHAPYNMMRYLQEHPADVVHVSEWCGSGCLSMLLKKQGLAFHDTLFVVKASAPWLWSRLYTSMPLERVEDIDVIDAERSSVELADLVIGGSLHLLRWMLSRGYRLPAARSFVQPNVVLLDRLPALRERGRSAAGGRVQVREIVFFGRLEARKGLVIFCHAIERLIRLGVPLPPRISFVGRPGGRLPARPQQTALEFIGTETAAWPCEVGVRTDLERDEALGYLLEGGRLAVMPSLIENSSVAVYEAALCGVPFIATGVGGTPELLVEADRAQVLCEPHPVALADKLAGALRDGACIARASFDNDANLRVWRDFHEQLARGLLERLLDGRGRAPANERSQRVSVCVYCTGGGSGAATTLAQLARQTAPPAEVLLLADRLEPAAGAQLAAAAAAHGLRWRLLEASDLDAGSAFNRAAELAAGDFLLLLWQGATLETAALQTLLRAAAAGAEVLSYFHLSTGAAGAPPKLVPGLVGGVARSFFGHELRPLPLFVRRRSFLDLAGFTGDYRALGYDSEFVARARIAGLGCETVPLQLGTMPALDPDWLRRNCYDPGASSLRAIRPFLAAAPKGLDELLMVSKGLLNAAPRRAAARRGSRWRHFGIRWQPGPPVPAAPAEAATAPSCVLAALRGRLHGWLRGAGPEARLEACCGRRVLRVVAQAAPPADGDTAVPSLRFVLPLFPRWLPGAVQRGQRRLSLRLADSAAAFAGDLLVAAPGERIEDSAYEGYCDPSDDGIVQGWIWVPAAPDRCIDVGVFADGRLLARLAANRPRDDLRAAGIGGGQYGFQLRLPAALRDGRPHRIEVAVAEEGLLLSRGTLLAQGLRVQPLAAR